MSVASAACTKKRDLRDGRPIWSDSKNSIVGVARLTRDESCDVLVVGAGITGALMALHLARDGHEVIIADRRQPGHGSTIASTAMIQFELDLPLSALSERIGTARAHRVYARSFKAVKDLKVLIARYGIDCDWVDRNSLYLAGSGMGSRGLMTEAKLREKVALPSVYLDRQSLFDRFGFSRQAAIHSSGAAELDPIKLAVACLKAAKHLGTRLHVPVTVSGAQGTVDGRIKVHTDDGPTITCRKVVMATGYETSPGIPRRSFDIVSSWAIATQPISPARLWHERCLVWEAADPYLYMRTTVDNRILVGGEDSALRSPVRRASAIAAKSKKLLDKAVELTGLADLKIDYAWAGAFAENPKGMPVFRPLQELPGSYAVLGCGGNGITFSMIGAQIVSARIAGRTDKDALLFDS